MAALRADRNTFVRQMVLPLPAFPEAFITSQVERIVPKDCKLRRVKYLNNVIGQGHRFVKKRVRASQCFMIFARLEAAEPPAGPRGPAGDFLDREGKGLLRRARADGEVNRHQAFSTV